LYTIQDHDLSWPRVKTSSSSTLAFLKMILFLWFQIHHIMVTHIHNHNLLQFLFILWHWGNTTLIRQEYKDRI